MATPEAQVPERLRRTLQGVRTSPQATTPGTAAAAQPRVAVPGQQIAAALRRAKQPRTPAAQPRSMQAAVAQAAPAAPAGQAAARPTAQRAVQPQALSSPMRPQAFAQAAGTPLTALPLTTAAAIGTGGPGGGIIPIQPPEQPDTPPPPMVTPALVGGFAQAGQALVSPEADQLRELALREALGLADAPSREQIALQRFQNILAESEDERRMGIRDIGRAAAALGRIGAGITTSQLGDLESRIQETQQRAARDLAAEAAGLELADRVARLGAIGQLGQQVGAEDLARAGFATDVRAMEADIGFQQRRLDLMEQGMSADDAYRRAAFEWEQQRFGRELTQREREFARTFGLDEREFRRRVLDSLLQAGFSDEEAEMWANAIVPGLLDGTGTVHHVPAA